MTRVLVATALMALLAIAAPADARTARSHAARSAFVHEHPCPATGKRYGRCPGWVVDHVDPLCHGGADAPFNMQWQTIADAKRKDGWERQLCRGARSR